MAHLAVDAALAEMAARGLLDPIVESQLAGVAGRARRLINRAFRDRMKPRDIRSLRAGRIDDPPIVEPGGSIPAVLNRKHQNARIGQASRIGLLPFRSDDVIDRIAIPPGRFAFADLDDMPSLLHERSRAIRDSLTGGKIADHVARAIRAKHPGHTRGLPPLVDGGVAFATRVRSRVRAGRRTCGASWRRWWRPPQRRHVLVEAEAVGRSPRK